jgi:hypothetical protein
LHDKGSSEFSLQCSLEMIYSTLIFRVGEALGSKV